MKKFAKILDKITDYVGYLAAISLLLMLFNVFLML